MTRMVVITPDGEGAVMQASSDLDTLRALVGGPIQEVFPSTGDTLGWHGYVDEEGKIKAAAPNPVGTAVALTLGWTPLPGDYLCGPLVLLGDSPDGEEGDLPLPVVKAIEAYYNARPEGVDKEDTADTAD